MYVVIMMFLCFCVSVCLCSLKKAIAFHRQKRKEDSNNAMTVVLKNVQKTAGAKPILDDLIVAMDRGTVCCMYVCTVCMYLCID